MGEVQTINLLTQHESTIAEKKKDTGELRAIKDSRDEFTSIIRAWGEARSQIPNPEWIGSTLNRKIETRID